jgi:hypothetical protein
LPKTATFEQMFLTDFAKNCQVWANVFNGLCQKLPSLPMLLKVFAKDCQVWAKGLRLHLCT